MSSELDVQSMTTVPVIGAFGDAIIAEADRVNVWRHGEACDDQVFAGGGFCGGVCPVCAVFEHVGRGFAPEVVDGELIGRSHHVLCHWLAHVSDADPCDFHLCVFFSVLRFSRVVLDVGRNDLGTSRPRS